MLGNKRGAIWFRGSSARCSCKRAETGGGNENEWWKMKKPALIAALLVAASPAAAQVSTSANQGLSPGQTSGLTATQAAPTTGVSCVEEMTATFCNVPAGPNTGGYGGGGGGSAGATSGSGAAGGLSANGSTTGGNASSLPPCPGEPPFNELCN
jgi:hypothetical protein